MSAPSAARTPGAPAHPRLGFLGVGWIGRARLQALVAAEIADALVIADTVAENRARALEAAPRAVLAHGLEELLEYPLDGIVIATPSALHAEQAVRALEHGLSVFCQKPLGRDAREVRRVVDAARAADRLLCVDLSYRHTEAARRVRERVQGGQLGSVYAVELLFHNAYGPDKPWFYDKRLSGGGCVMDLGVHLVDLALWTLGFPRVDTVSSRLLARGVPLQAGDSVEDYATACLGLETGALVQLACSWGLPAGREAVIQAAFYGTHGGAALRNVAGSFYDFRAEAFAGTTSCALAVPPDAWGGRALLEWAGAVGRGEGFSAEAEQLLQVAETLDAIYAEGVVSPRERRG